MKNLLLILGFTCSSLVIFGQTGDVFPEIDVLDLNNEALTIPADIKGKFSLIGVAFSEDAQQDLYTWSQPVFSEFLQLSLRSKCSSYFNVHRSKSTCLQ